MPIAPQRLVDTRSGLGAPRAPLGGQQAIDVRLVGGASVPAGASAVVTNVATVDSSQPSYITAWPTGAPRPKASTLNPRPGVAVPNQAYLQVGANGSLSVFNFAGSTDVFIDVFGYVE